MTSNTANNTPDECDLHYFASHRSGKFRSIYQSAFQVEIYGDVPIAVTVRELDVPEPGCYYGWRQSGDGIHHIYATEIQVKLCSPDFFKSAIERGEGKIVPLSIRLRADETSQQVAKS